MPEDKANGAKPMETDAEGPNKRRRITNRVYVGSSDLSYRREHMEVCSAAYAAINWHPSCTAVCNHKTVSNFADYKTYRWKGLCIKDYTKTSILSRSFGSMPSSELYLLAVVTNTVLCYSACCFDTCMCNACLITCSANQVLRLTMGSCTIDIDHLNRLLV